MMYPLVRELAADGIPVAVTCRVLRIARQPNYRWLADPVTDAELEAAYLANAVFDAHRDDPEFGYRYLADEARDGGHTTCDRTVWRICSANGWWSAFGKKRGKNGRPGPPVHDDLVERDFTADAPNQLWLADITEHKTDERRPALVRSLAKLVADAASVDLKEPSHFSDARILPVQVHVFAPESDISGPSAEILIDHRGKKPWNMEIVFDGLNCSRDAAHWIVGVLVSAAEKLEASRTLGD